VGGPFLSKFGGPKTLQSRRDFGQLRDFIANISGMQQDIVKRKTVLQNYEHFHTSKLNSVYFGPQTAKIGPEFWPTQRAAIRLCGAAHLIVVLLQDVPVVVHSLNGSSPVLNVKC